MLVVSTPAARSARARASMLSSYTRTASDTKPGLKFTMTTTPFDGTSLRMESGTSRAWPVSARGDEGILDGVSPLDADQARDFPRPEVPFDIRGPIGHREVARILRTQPLDQVDLLQRVHRRMRPRVHRRDGHIRRPELRPYTTCAELRDVGHELRLPHGEIHRVDPAARADGVRDVVVAVDQGDGLEDAERS